MSAMHYSRTDMMTVRDMIDDAIIYSNDEPVVDFNLIEAVLYIIARHLNVLDRQVKVEWNKYKAFAQAKADKKKKKKKTLMAITEIKIHRKFGKDHTTTDSTTEQSTSFKAHQRRRKSRSKSKDASALYIDEDEGGSNKRARSKSKDGEDSKKQGRYQDEDEEGSKKRGRSKSRLSKDFKKQGRYQDEDEEDLKKRGPSKSRLSKDFKKQGRYQDEDEEDSKKRGRSKVQDGEDSKKRGQYQGKDEESTKQRGRSKDRAFDDSKTQGHYQDGVSKKRGRSKGKAGEDYKEQGWSQDEDDESSKKRGRSRGRTGADYKKHGRYQDEDEEGSTRRGRSKGRAGEDFKKHGRYQVEDEEGSVIQGHYKDKHDEHSKKHGRYGGRYDENTKKRGGRYTDEYDEDTIEHGGHKGTYDEDLLDRGRHRVGHDEHSVKRGRHGGGHDEYLDKRGRHGGRHDEHSEKRGRHAGGPDDYPGTRGRHGGGYYEDTKKGGRYRGEYDEDSMEDYRGGYHEDKRGRYKDGDSRNQGRRFRGGSLDVVPEKVLVVSRRSSEESMDDRDRDYRNAVVTQHQFDSMLSEVRKLQEKFGVVSNVNASWSNLHKPTTLTDPRAALNMAARLDAAHRRLNQMMIVVTKFASKVPGINLDGKVDDSFVQSSHQKLKESASSKGNIKSLSKSSANMTEVEETVLDECLLEEANIEKEDLATWQEFTAELNEMQQVVCDTMSTAANDAADTAKRASKSLKLTAPKLSEAQILNVKFARLRILVDHFSTNADALDVKMATQMGDAQERVSQLQFEVETIIERIDEHLAHPAEDPGAVAAIKEDFAVMTTDLTAAKKNQDALKELHEQSALEFERLRRKLEVIRQIKTTREEALDALKTKARVTDVNSFLSTDQLYAVVGYLQQEISQTNSKIDSGEVMWQNCIDDHVASLHAKGDRVQVTTLHHSLLKYLVTMDTRVSNMLDIVGEFPVPFFKKKLDRDGNCLSCGAAANVEASGKYGQLAKRMKNREVMKHIMKEKGTDPCVPGRPIPHPLDPRALVCDRFCGASISKTGESLSSMGLDVAQVNRTQKPDTMDINTVQNKKNPK